MALASVCLRHAEAASGHCSRAPSAPIPPVAAVLFCAFAALACATKNPPPSFGYDRTANFLGLKTYAWLEKSAHEAPRGDSIVDGTFIDRAVRRAVSENLQRKGLQRSTAETADIYVDYNVADAGGLTWDKYASYQNTGFLKWSWQHVENAGTNYSRRSVVVLEIRNVERKLVWQGLRESKEGKTPSEIARSIQSAVEVLLSEFPPRGLRQTQQSSAVRRTDP